MNALEERANDKYFVDMLHARNYFFVALMLAEEQTRVNFTESSLGFIFQGKKIINPFRTPEGKRLEFADAISYYGMKNVENFRLDTLTQLAKLSGEHIILDSPINIVRSMRVFKEMDKAKEEGRKPCFDSIKADYPELFRPKTMCA